MAWTLSVSNSNDRTTHAKILNGKTGGVESVTRSGSPDEEVALSCPKKPRTTMRKRKASAMTRSVVLLHMLITRIVIYLMVNMTSFLASPA